MEPDELADVIRRKEGERLELKSSLNAESDKEDVREAACAFANDFPNSRKPGLVVIGVRDDLGASDVPISEDLFHFLEATRDDYRLSPPVICRVFRSRYSGREVAVLKVEPSQFPPVRFKGRTCIRIGERRDYASFEEEARLRERVSSGNLPFDMRPCHGSSLADLSASFIQEEYLPRVLPSNLIAEDRRPLNEKLAALRLYDLESDCPTNCGILLFGENPTRYIPGAYVQYVRYDRTYRGEGPVGDLEFRGSLLQQLEDAAVFLKGPVAGDPSASRDPGEEFALDFPAIALRELLVNAVMHRAYDGTTSPTRLSHFVDRIELQNPGGLFGQVTRRNFGRTSDYRNPAVADVLRTFQYVEKFGSGIARVKLVFRKNGNPTPRFDLDDPLSFQVTVSRPPKRIGV